jgi:hypothetical protein
MARTKNKRSAWSILLIGVFLFSFVCFLLCLKGYFFPATISLEKPVALKDDDFDPSLMRLNTMAKLEAYCDSFYLANRTTRVYPGIVSQVVRKRFFHGYSYYNVYNDPIAVMCSPVIKEGLSAIVLPNDILKYPYAACSQQSLVGMELIRKKGFQVRKVTMYDNPTQKGHFAFEAFYDNDWHYFDPNQEPDYEVLKKYNRPSVAFLNEHPDIIAAAYCKKDQQLFQRLLRSSEFGPVNEKLAPMATFYQRSTKFFSNFGWLIVGLFILIRYAVITRKPIFRMKSIRKKQAQFHHAHSGLHGKEARA